ncbi:hypothetical protein [Bacillus manliponensis]|uniref:hypothetical protein n=1 Tax=Bacillus manliponensis TaxID=574376 RepID=UPI0035135981
MQTQKEVEQLVPVIVTLANGYEAIYKETKTVNRLEEEPNLVNVEEHTSFVKEDGVNNKESPQEQSSDNSKYELNPIQTIISGYTMTQQN